MGFKGVFVTRTSLCDAMTDRKDGQAKGQIDEQTETKMDKQRRRRTFDSKIMIKVDTYQS